jgi:hypothetical protein
MDAAMFMKLAGHFHGREFNGLERSQATGSEEVF